MRRTLLALAVAGSLALAACGGDDDDAAAETTAAPASTEAVETTEPPASSAPETTAATTTTERATTTTAAATTTAATGATTTIEGDGGGDDPDADAAALVWSAAFDSALAFDAKAPLIADAEALRPTIEAYTPAGAAVGGITLVPTDVQIDGDTAAITYDVRFAGQTAYSDQTGTLHRVDGVWQVSREEFCAFMASARNPCP
jgi:iron complex transport system substrate-binding protein